jgi:molybdopterin-binding protein
MTIHNLPPGGISPERIAEIARIGQTDPRVRGYRSFHSPAEGRIVWLLEAPDKETVAAWCARVGLPLDAITELELEGHRGVIRRVRISLPNQLHATITDVRQDATTALIAVRTEHGITIDAFLTPDGWNVLRLNVGDPVVVLFKAMNVSLEKSLEGTPDMLLSFPNQIKGTVTRIIEGPTLFVVHVDTPAGEIVSAIIPSAAERISLKIGDEVTALFKALDVSLAKAAEE